MTAGEGINTLMAMPLRADIFTRIDGRLILIQTAKLENGYGLPFLPGTDEKAIIVLEGADDGSR